MKTSAEPCAQGIDRIQMYTAHQTSSVCTGVVLSDSHDDFLASTNVMYSLTFSLCTRHRYKRARHVSSPFLPDSYARRASVSCAGDRLRVRSCLKFHELVATVSTIDNVLTGIPT